MKRLIYSFLLILFLASCTNDQAIADDSFIDYINVCIVAKFASDYPENELVNLYTTNNYPYYLTNVYYRVEFDNSIYKTEYISAVNDKNELVVREVLCCSSGS